MKINTSGLHPLYDQYSNEENRVLGAGVLRQAKSGQRE